VEVEAEGEVAQHCDEGIKLLHTHTHTDTPTLKTYTHSHTHTDGRHYGQQLTKDAFAMKYAQTQKQIEKSIKPAVEHARLSGTL